MVMPLGDMERTRILPIATYVLIAMNVAGYFLEVERGEDFKVAYAATPHEITHGEDLDIPVEVDEPAADGRPGTRHVIPHAPGPSPIWLTLLTSLFLHASPLHLAGNMLFLWIFGDNVEEVLGTVRYLLVYLCCGVMGTVAQIAANPDSHIPTLGASGAIAGIMGLYVVWFPHNRVRVLLFRIITEMPALYVIGGWLGLQILAGVAAFDRIGRVGGVAYLAHIGGITTGIACAFLFGDLARAHAASVHDESLPII